MDTGNLRRVMALPLVGIPILFSCGSTGSISVDKQILNDDYDYLWIEIKGFYHSHGVWLCEKLSNNKLYCFSRYGTNEGKIETILDLAKINLKWFLHSKRRYPDVTEPDEEWVPYIETLSS